MSLRLLTFNVFLRPPPIKTNADDYKEQRFQQILKLLDRYDIICFEQMFQTGSFRPERIIQAAIKKKFFYWKSSEPPSFFPGPVVDSGLLIISRLPFEVSHFQSYGIGILSDSASDKGYIYCKITTSKGPLHLFATHLQASYKLPGKQIERQLSVKTRLYQFDRLLNKIKNHLRSSDYKEDELVLLVGDLNVDSREKSYELSLNSHLKKLPQMKVQGPSEESLLAKDKASEPFVEIDHIMRLFRLHEVEVTDHGFEKYQEHPITFGDGDTILTGEEDVTSKQSLDYIFSLYPGGKKHQTKLVCKTDTCQVQQFKHEGSKYGQLSDHYGLSITIE